MQHACTCVQGKAGQADSAVQRASKAAQAADSAADNLQQLAGKLKAVLVEKRASLGALEAADASRKLHAEGLQAEVQAAKGRVAAAMQELQGKRQRLQQVHITSQVAKSELEEIAAGQGSQGASALDAAILELAAPIGNARIRSFHACSLHQHEHAVLCSARPQHPRCVSLTIFCFQGHLLRPPAQPGVRP